MTTITWNDHGQRIVDGVVDHTPPAQDMCAEQRLHLYRLSVYCPVCNETVVVMPVRATTIVHLWETAVGQHRCASLTKTGVR